MSQVLNEPWLCTLFSKDMRLNVDNTKDGRRVQMFNFKRAEDRYPVTCEISDKTNYMRAALTKKSVSAFERKEERQIETVSGAAFQIQTFRIMLFRGQQPGVLKKGKRRSKIRDDECPRRIRDGQEPQLWMLITNWIRGLER
ncbi:hypothetical protein GGF43_000873 [Coemansia sp. RSA 2618]|nr:hypothetical protein GGF43_000873 [Coemansia sp. RSA 2618]